MQRIWKATKHLKLCKSFFPVSSGIPLCCRGGISNSASEDVFLRNQPFMPFLKNENLQAALANRPLEGYQFEHGLEANKQIPHCRWVDVQALAWSYWALPLCYCIVLGATCAPNPNYYAPLRNIPGGWHVSQLVNDKRQGSNRWSLTKFRTSMNRPSRVAIITQQLIYSSMTSLITKHQTLTIII